MQDLTDEKKNQKTGAQKSVAKWNSRTDKKKAFLYGHQIDGCSVQLCNEPANGGGSSSEDAYWSVTAGACASRCHIRHACAPEF
jgi:hypothetical protein